MKRSFFMVAVAILGIVAAIFVSCQRDELVSNSSELTLKSAFIAVDGDCETDCIEPGGPYYEQLTSKDYTAGPQGSVTVTEYNTGTSMVYKLTSTNAIRKVTFNGTDLYASGTPAAQPYYIIVPLEAGWYKCQEVTAVIGVRRENNNGVGGGTYLKFETSYKLFELCEGPEPQCDEGFEYETVDNMTVLFTYTSEIDMVGAVVQFTCPHITGFTALDGKVLTSNPGKGKGAPTVLTWVGDITACEPITFELAFTPDCSQNAAGFANVWTDFKVNGVSKKAITPPVDQTEWPIIKYKCN